MKKLTITFFTAFLILMLSVNGQLNFNPEKANDDIDSFIEEQMDIFHVPGLSACIIIGDSIVWNNNYGYMNLEDSIPVHDSTLFMVFSIGKTVSCHPPEIPRTRVMPRDYRTASKADFHYRYICIYPL